MIYVSCHIPAIPCGGVRKTYRHVDVLNRHGIEACILHNAPGERVRWFANSTPIMYWDLGKGVRIRPEEDILVISGPLLQFWEEFEPRATKVIFNQGAYLTFHTQPGDKVIAPVESLYTKPNVLGAICVSEDSRKYLQWVFPELFLQRIRHAIDPSIFCPKTKLPQISYMPRRRQDHALQILRMLQVRGMRGSWNVVEIHGKSEAETAQILGNSSIFLSFSELEGFGLPPAEAMACECVVVGYHGMGGREFFLPEHSFPIQDSAILDYAQTVQQVMELRQNDRAAFSRIGSRAREFIRRNYSLEQEESDIVGAWQALLARRGCK